jgi:hypothetical protein
MHLFSEGFYSFQLITTNVASYHITRHFDNITIVNGNTFIDQTHFTVLFDIAFICSLVHHKLMKLLMIIMKTMNIYFQFICDRMNFKEGSWYMLDLNTTHYNTLDYKNKTLCDYYAWNDLYYICSVFRLK